jgi:hypothetical protein
VTLFGVQLVLQIKWPFTNQRRELQIIYEIGKFARVPEELEPYLRVASMVMQRQI